MPRATHYHSCTLCEATCGVAVTVDGDRVVDVRGDERDPSSKGYICPKATALADLHHDPDRLRTPLVRARLADGSSGSGGSGSRPGDGAGGSSGSSSSSESDGWREVGWDEALDLVTGRLRRIRHEHGNHAIGVYQGNPTAHNLGLVTYGQLLFRSLGTRNLYSATSIDQLPHMLAALLMFGHQLLMPVPDVDRCDLFVCLGGNPAVSNGSIMTAPDIRGRLKAMRARGGRLVVVDPRRTETADLADQHLFIRPGTDAMLLLSIVHVLFAEDLVRPGRLAAAPGGLDAVAAAAADFPPEATAAATGIAPDDVRALARAVASTPRAVVYGRVGLCTQEFGGLAAWLVLVVNAITGHLDQPGGAMFSTPAIDPLTLLSRVGHGGSFGRWRSRVSGLPEFGGELPVAALAEEIETPGDRQIRALITSAGNPVLSTPNGTRLEKALAGLDFMVAIDPYLNETTRLADVILPPTGQLERSHYEIPLSLYAVRNVAKYSPPVFPRGPDQRHDWEICIELAARLLAPAPRRAPGRLRTTALRRLGTTTPGRLLGGLAAGAGRLGTEALLEFALRAGPHGLRRGPGGLSLRRLRRSPHGVDLGPLEPRLPGRLHTRDGKVHLAPPEYLADLHRLRARLSASSDGGGLLLIGRRHLRSNNSWLHNSQRLVKGKPRCTLLMHPADAAVRGLTDGAPAVLSSRVGSVEVPVEVTDSIMAGVVSLPHGWGHSRPGARLSVAAEHPGVSVNDITDERLVDALTGNAAVSGVPVEVAPLPDTRSG